MMNYVFTFAAGLAAGIVLEKALSKMYTSTVAGRTDTLRACFGEPMCTTTFTFNEAKEWIKSRETALSNGSKAVIAKANSKTLKGLGKEMNIDGVDNYLVMAIINQSNDIQDSILIKYECLDQDLENSLAKGNGILDNVENGIPLL